MKIQNPLQMNDWNIKKFLEVIISLQISLLGLVLLEEFGITIPILRQLIAFICLTFIPGLLILRILKLHRLGNTKTILYSVGLSLSFLMFIGFSINSLYPKLGIMHPLSFLSLLLTTSFIFIILCILCYLQDKDFTETNYTNIKIIPKQLILTLTPFVAILGTYLVNYYNNNIILMVLILIIGLIPILISFDKIEEKFYPIMIFTIALSLLYSIELISGYITGYDVNFEYYYSNLVNLDSIWSLQGIGSVNSVLSIVMLVPFYSKILNLDINGIFKIVFPFFYALIPVVLYLIFKNQTNSKIAFMSCFVFVAFFKYYQGYLGRQGIAEFFLALLILLFLENNHIKNSILLIIFAFALAVSHYGLSYLFIFALLALYILETMYNKFTFNKIGKYQFKRLNLSFILFFIVLTIGWYMFTSNASGFNAIVNIGNHIFQTIFTEFFDANSSQSLAIISTVFSPLHELSKYIHLILQFFILIGFLVVFKFKLKFKKEYLIISLFFLFILIASFFVPYLAGALNTNRLYQISLMFLAPFSVVGGLFLINFVLSKGNLKKENMRGVSLKLMTLFIILFFFFNVGFVYECFNDQPQSISLSQKNIEIYGTNLDKASFFSAYYKEQDVNSVEWLSHNKEYSSQIYTDYMNRLILKSYGMVPWGNVLKNGVTIKNSSYIYFRSVNILYGILYSGGNTYYDKKDLEPQTNESDLIYSNGFSEILFIEKTTSKIQYDEKNVSME